MIGILGGMGTQAGLDFCSKLAKLNRGKADQKYPLFVLYNKASIPDRKQHNKKYKKVLNSLIEGCKFLQKNKCKFIAMPCNTAHFWYLDLKKKVKVPILNMPELVCLNKTVTCSFRLRHPKNTLSCDRLVSILFAAHCLPISTSFAPKSISLEKCFVKPP